MNDSEPRVWIDFLSEVFPGVSQEEIAAVMRSGFRGCNIGLGQDSPLDEQLPDAGK